MFSRGSQSRAAGRELVLRTAHYRLIEEVYPMADIVKTPAKDRQEMTRAEATHSGPQFAPRVDIHETEKELTLLADLPGVAPKDVDLHYENGELLLLGKVQPLPNDRSRLLLEEYEVGDFYRVFSIHESIDSGRI